MIREGALRFDLPSEAALVFLYDEASVPALRSAQADVVLGGADPAAEHPAAVRALEAERAIVAYGLEQDDDVAVEVVVGPELTAKEKAGLPWMPVQRSVLRLPSGKLRVDTCNTSLFAADPPGDAGGELAIPPGDYAVAIHRVRIDGLPLEAGEAYEGAREIVTLTPVKGETSTKARAFLPFERAKAKPKPARAKGTAAGGWKGTVLEPGDVGVTLDFDEQSARELGLRFGQALRVGIGKSELTCIYTGTLDAVDYWSIYQEEHRARRPEVAIASLVPHLGAEGRVLAIARPLPSLTVFKYENLGLGKVRRGAAAHATALPMELEPLDTDLDGAWRLEDGAAVGAILATMTTGLAPSLRVRLVTTIAAEALERLGAAAGARLRVRVGDRERPLFVGASLKELMARAMAPKPGSGEERSNLRSEWMSAAGDIAAREAIAERIERLRVPAGFDEMPLGVFPMAHWAFPERRLLCIVPMVEEAALGVMTARRTVVEIRA